MTAIWIDLWDKKCWIAIEIENIAIPKEVVLRTKIISYLNSLLKEYPLVDTILVWLAYDLYWKDLRQLVKTQEFIRELTRKFKNYKIIWIDERYSSFEANLVLKELNMDLKWIKNDDISASIILETYLRYIWKN